MRARRPHEFKRQDIDFIGTSTMAEGPTAFANNNILHFLSPGGFILNHDFGYIETSRVSLVAGSL